MEPFILPASPDQLGQALSVETEIKLLWTAVYNQEMPAWIAPNVAVGHLKGVLLGRIKELTQAVSMSDGASTPRETTDPGPDPQELEELTHRLEVMSMLNARLLDALGLMAELNK